jgi:phosphatidylinositol-3-phosphatase
VFNDNDPYPANVQNTPNSLSNYLQRTGRAWRSYQEDTGVSRTANQPVAKSQYMVPLTSFSGTFGAGSNRYNGSNQYNCAAKHNPQIFFISSNGGNNPTNANPLAQNYAPLQQLATDLANNAVARYNWITPDQYNDMHSTLSGGFTYHGMHLTGDAAKIAQGDNFLSIIVPEIEASQAYKNDGAIIIWWDETENGDDPNHRLGEIIISPDAKGNAYTNNIFYTHSSDLLTMQEIYNIGPCLLAACSANNLADLFKPGSIPNQITTDLVPEPSSMLLLVAGLFGVALTRRRVLP